MFLGLLQVFFYCCGADGCLVFIFLWPFFSFWRCLFLGVTRFGCFGFACISSFCFVYHGMVLMETFNDSISTPRIIYCW